MKILKFIWYCISCMFEGFSAMFGHTDGYTIKEFFIGIATLFVIVLTFVLLIIFTRKKRKK